MKKSRILYVEDEIFLAKIVGETLETKGFEVTMVHDGDQALQAFTNSRPDVCILDIMLPGKDGFSIADEIREKNREVPIIFLSAKSATEDVVNGFKIGANDYIRKPFSIEELIVRIENVLKKLPSVKESEGDEIHLGRFQFNSRRQTLIYEGEEKKLSYRESELLRLLYENRETIVERKDILNLLWGSDSFFNSRNLDVYITKLRNYLKQDPALQIITVKGVGYRFIVA